MASAVTSWTLLRSISTFFFFWTFSQIIKESHHPIGVPYDRKNSRSGNDRVCATGLPPNASRIGPPIGSLVLFPKISSVPSTLLLLVALPSS